MSVSVGTVVSQLHPVWLDGGRPCLVDLWVGSDWEPTAEYAHEQGARRGDVVALARVTKRCLSTWKHRISGSDIYEDVPNWSEPVFEYLRTWRWTGRSWKPAA